MDIKKLKKDKSGIVWIIAIVAVIVIKIVLAEGFYDLFFWLNIAWLSCFLLINIVRQLPALQMRTVNDVLAWAFYQSGSLLLIAFSHRFETVDRKAFWIGLIGLTAIFSVGRISSYLLKKRFDKIEKM